MPYFLDSNVFIGYYFFCGDMWGNQAKKLVEIPEQKHSSDHVWHECFGVDGCHGRCKTILQEIKDEFFSAISLLTKDRYSPVDLFSVVTEEKWRTMDIIQELAARYEHDIKQLERKIRFAERKYESDCDDRLSLLKKPAIIQLHERDVEYPELFRTLKSVIEDESDVVILLDAHHVGGTLAGLDFVSGDHYHVYRNRQTIIDHTNIANVSFLDYF
ncbi:MAG: hypothetical protein ABSG49_00905 [Methanoregula sp.]|jgi:hypothetical protein|uniref:hypothetical protein n=1 Tax=Methanoregula sp. TaxID=2052170 RepID=UPI003C18379B